MTDKIKRNLSTQKNREWWEEVKKAAANAPKLNYKKRGN